MLQKSRITRSNARQRREPRPARGNDEEIRGERVGWLMEKLVGRPRIEPGCGFAHDRHGQRRSVIGQATQTEPERALTAGTPRRCPPKLLRRRRVLSIDCDGRIHPDELQVRIREERGNRCRPLTLVRGCSGAYGEAGGAERGNLRRGTGLYDDEYVVELDAGILRLRLPMYRRSGYEREDSRDEPIHGCLRRRLRRELLRIR